MSTFLQLCQRVAQESGTVSSGTSPSTVVAQTGRLGKIVNWTNTAWTDIQLDRSEWRWMRKELEEDLVASTQRYSASDLSVTSFQKWLVTGDYNEDRWSLYVTADGVETEGPIHFLAWDDFYTTQLRGTPPSEGRPRYFSIDDSEKLVFSPVPDVAYTLRGLYRKGVQTLAVDADTPEMPAAYHMLIVWEALKLLGNFDEASIQQRAEWAQNARRIRFNLERDQLPPVGICGPLA
jgi:hypothetical protein